MGNHFIELNRSESGDVYLCIHTGSRNLGQQVCRYYQKMAVDDCNGKYAKKHEIELLIAEYKKNSQHKKIQEAINKMAIRTYTSIIPLNVKLLLLILILQVLLFFDKLTLQLFFNK